MIEFWAYSPIFPNLQPPITLKPTTYHLQPNIFNLPPTYYQRCITVCVLFIQSDDIQFCYNILNLCFICFILGMDYISQTPKYRNL